MRSGVDLIGAMRTPSLRNLEGTAPYMHKGQMEQLSEVLDHYNRAPEAMIGHNEAEPLGLNDLELRQLEDFLNTLNGPVLTPIL
jgi:cytochrome c peroxidase